MTTNTQITPSQETIIAEAKDFADKFLGKVGSIPYGQSVVKARLVEVQVRKTASDIYVMGLYETDTTMPRGVSPYTKNLTYLHNPKDDIGMFPESIPSRKEPETSYVEANKWQWLDDEPKTGGNVELLFKQPLSSPS